MAVRRTNKAALHSIWCTCAKNLHDGTWWWCFEHLLLRPMFLQFLCEELGKVMKIKDKVRAINIMLHYYWLQQDRQVKTFCTVFGWTKKKRIKVKALQVWMYLNNALRHNRSLWTYESLDSIKVEDRFYNFTGGNQRVQTCRDATFESNETLFQENKSKLKAHLKKVL